MAFSNWFSQLFRTRAVSDAGLATVEARDGGITPAPIHLPATTQEPQDPPGEAEAVPGLSKRSSAFLTGLIEKHNVLAVGNLPKDDQIFVAGVMKRVRSRKLELPVMPQAAIRLSQMLNQRASATQLEALLKDDAALSVEVLRTANSPLYGASRKIGSLQEAIVRIGQERLQAILMTALLRSKVLKAGALKQEGNALLDLGLPLGLLASNVGSDRATAPDTCYMRGVLFHVEHLVILGIIGDVSRDARRSLVPSVAALHQVFVRFGPEVRRLVATEWQLTDLLLGGDDAARVSAEFGLLRKTLLSHWLGRPLPRLDWIEAEQVERVLSALTPRVGETKPQAH